MRYLLAATLTVLSAAPAFADAVTYQGTLGGHDILVELTEPGDGAVAGRYTYLSQGADIPLQARSADDHSWVLAEEAPCGEDDCPPGPDMGVLDPPIGATWTLILSEDGRTLAGTWQPADKGKSLPIALEPVARRPLEEAPTPYAMHDRSALLGYDFDKPLTAETAPYDVLRLEVAQQFSEVERAADGSIYNYVSDPRTVVAFPSVLALSDGSSTSAINDTLREHRWRMSLDAFDCKSFVYGGFGRTNDNGVGGGTMGGYEDETVTVNYLSPRVMSWTETGSLFCGGAHPNNHADNYNYDVRTGDPLDLSRIFSGWVATPYGAMPGETADLSTARANPNDYMWGPDEDLAEWVSAHRIPDADTQFEDECGIDDLITENLDVRFEGDDKVVFTLTGLPSVMFACSTDLVTVSLADIPELLAPEAKTFFPALAN